MGDTPRWIPVFFGSAMLLVGAFILGAQLGFVPTGDGQFLAPPVIIIALSLCLMLGGLLLWIPQRWPALIRATLFIVALAAMAIVCNWSAFAPGVVYNSSTSIGPLSFEGESRIGGRIAFVVVAIILDLFILDMLIGWARARFRRKG